MLPLLGTDKNQLEIAFSWKPIIDAGYWKNLLTERNVDNAILY